MNKSLLLLTALVFSFTLSEFQATSSQSHTTHKLHVEGTHLVNELGYRIHLHGVCKNEFIEDSSGMFQGPGDTWEDRMINNLNTLRDWGCNFLACGVLIEWILYNTDSGVGVGCLDALKRLVDLADDRGIYIGIGVFGANPSAWGGNLAGEWIVNNPQAYINFWTLISDEFKDNPNVIYNSLVEIAFGLDPNDPGQPLDPPDVTMNTYYNIVKQAVQAIRDNSDEHIFMYHEDYCGYPSRFDKPATEGGEMIRKLHEEFSNIVYDAHTYRTHGTFGGDPDVFNMASAQGDNSNGVYQREDIMDALEYWGYLKILEEYKVPIIMWEGGADSFLSPPNSWEKELTCWENVLTIFNELDIGYGAFWWRAGHRWDLINADLSPTEWGQILINVIASRGPEITYVSQTPPEDNVWPDDKVMVNAKISDVLSGVEQVILNFTNGNGTWVTIEMERLEGSIWNSTIPAFPLGTNITYVIIAEDGGGNIATTEQLGYIYQYLVIPEFPLFVILLLLMTLIMPALLLHRKTI